MAIFGGFNITKRRPDTSSLDNALRMYAGYKANKSNNEAAIERERIKAEAELRKALLKAESDAAKAAAAAGNKGKLDPTKFVQSLMQNYPSMTKDEAIGLYGQLLSGSTMTSNNDAWWENRDRGGRAYNGDAMEDISKGKSRDKAEPQVDFTEWKRNRIKKLTKVAVSGKTNPYEFQDEEGKTVVLSQSAYNDAMKNGTEGKVYVPAQGRFMTEAEAEGWAKRVARAANKIKPTISGVDDGSTNDGSNTNMDGSQNEAITFDFAPRANESKAAYAERMRMQREALKINATSDRDEVKHKADLKKANTKFELDMRKVGLYKASKLPNGELVLSVNPIGDFNEEHVWVRKDTAGNLYESDVNERQTEMKKAYDLWREANLIKPREERQLEDKKDYYDSTTAEQKEADRKSLEERTSAKQLESEQKIAKELEDKLKTDYNRLKENWNKPVNPTPLKDWTDLYDPNMLAKEYIQQMQQAIQDPMRNPDLVAQWYAKRYPDFIATLKSGVDNDTLARLNALTYSPRTIPTYEDYVKVKSPKVESPKGKNSPVVESSDDTIKRQQQELEDKDKGKSTLTPEEIEKIKEALDKAGL